MAKSNRQHAPRDRKHPLKFPEPPCTPKPPKVPPPPRPAPPFDPPIPDFRKIFKQGRRGRH